MSFDTRLNEVLTAHGLKMPAAPTPKGLYRSILVVGTTLYTSGHLPIDAEGRLITGRLGAGMDVEAGSQAARWAALNLLAAIRQELGSLDVIRRVIRVFGAVNCTPEFTQQPAVVNGCSELLAEVFGREAGVGVRTAIGAASLPLGVPVEIDALLELK